PHPPPSPSRGGPAARPSTAPANFFPAPPDSRVGGAGVGRPRHLESEPEDLEPLPAGLRAHPHAPPAADVARHLRAGPQPAVGRTLPEDPAQGGALPRGQTRRGPVPAAAVG